MQPDSGEQSSVDGRGESIHRRGFIPDLSANAGGIVCSSRLPVESKTAPKTGRRGLVYYHLLLPVFERRRPQARPRGDGGACSRIACSVPNSVRSRFGEISDRRARLSRALRPGAPPAGCRWYRPAQPARRNRTRRVAAQAWPRMRRGPLPTPGRSWDWGRAYRLRSPRC